MRVTKFRCSRTRRSVAVEPRSAFRSQLFFFNSFFQTTQAISEFDETIVLLRHA
jgi:hypothetical protein